MGLLRKFVVELNRKSSLSIRNLVSKNYSLAAKMDFGFSLHGPVLYGIKLSKLSVVCIQMRGMSVLLLFCMLAHWNLYLKVMLLLDLFIPWVWVMV